MSNKDVWDWQRRFHAALSVWVCEDPDGVLNLYESREAAEREMAFRSRYGCAKGYRIRQENIHSLELAKERWDE